MLTAWALQLDTGDPEHPGLISDYLSLYDFTVTITKAHKATGEIETTISSSPRTAGTA